MIIEIKNLCSGYRKGDMILKEINLRISDNEIVAVVGQNGSGKSTLAKSVIGLVPFRSGEIYYKDIRIDNLKTDKITKLGLSYFMQGGRIFPNLTIEENLQFSGINLKRGEFSKRKNEMLSMFDILQKSNLMKMKASFLSGGEQQQLAIAMILMQKPDFIIFDEPSAGLSPSNVKNLYEILGNIYKNHKIGFLIIEQNVDEAVRFSDKIYLLSNGEIIRETKKSEIKNFNEIDNFFFGKLN